MLFGASLRTSVVALALSVMSFSTVSLHAAAFQSATAKTNIDDTWQGTLHAQKDLRTVVKITRGADGSLKAVWYSIDQQPRPVPVKTTTFQNGELRLSIEDIDGVYTGRMSSDGNTITGEWEQIDKSFPLVFARVTPQTEGTIPEPPKPIPPMAKDANPSWE